MAAKIGFIGLGIMGVGMAKNLVTKGNKSLVVWNRSKDKSEAFKSSYADCDVVDTAKQVLEQCDLIYCMLSDLNASISVYNADDGILAGVTAGKKIVDCATLTPEHMQGLNSKVTEKGGIFLEAPVSGSKGPAEQGTLIFLCAGDKSLYDSITADLDVMGKAAFFFGEEVGQGSRMKLVVNMIMGGMMTCLSEGMALAESASLPVDDLLKVLDLGAMSNPLFRLKGPKMAVGDHAPNFPLKHAQKDMRFAVNLGDDLGVSMPVSAASNEMFKRARTEYGDEDLSAVYEVYKRSKKEA